MQHKLTKENKILFARDSTFNISSPSFLSLYTAIFHALKRKLRWSFCRFSFSPFSFFFFFLSCGIREEERTLRLFTIRPPFKKIRFTRILVLLEFTKSHPVEGIHGDPRIARVLCEFKAESPGVPDTSS